MEKNNHKEHNMLAKNSTNTASNAVEMNGNQDHSNHNGNALETCKPNFLHPNATSLIASELQFYNDSVNCHPLKRNIEAYCTVRKPRKFSFPATVIQNESASNEPTTVAAAAVIMGNNNQSQIVSGTENDEDDSDLENSLDSTNQSLLRNLSDNDSCLDGMVLSKDESTLSGPDIENELKLQGFEDNFIDVDAANGYRIDDENKVPISNYCTLRQKPKVVDMQEKVVAAYGTLKRKMKSNKKLSKNEEELFNRISKVNSFDCNLQVQDYLKELDAYLEEMDYSTTTSTATSSTDDLVETVNNQASPSTSTINTNNDCAINSIQFNSIVNTQPGNCNVNALVTVENNVPNNSGNNSTENNKKNNNMQQLESDLMATNGGSSSSSSGVFAENLQPLSNKEQLKKNVNPFLTLPKLKKVNGSDLINANEDDVENFVNEQNSDENFRRGYSMRLPGRPKLFCWNAVQNRPVQNFDVSTPVTRNSSIQMRPKPQSSWLRTSMRKTSPIPMPDDNQFETMFVPPIDFQNNSAVPFQNTPVTCLEANAIVSSEATNAIENESQMQSSAQLSNERELFNDSLQSFNTVYYDANSNYDSICSRVTQTPETSILIHSTPSAPPRPISARAELSHDDILNILNQSDPDSPSRPRQHGRRSETRPRVVAIEVSSGDARISTEAPTPSAPPAVHARAQLAPPSQYTMSNPSSLGTSRNTSPVSIASSTASSSIASATAESQTQRTRPRRNQQANSTAATNATIMTSNTNDPEDEDDRDTGSNNSNKHKWPYIFSRTLATCCCTIGLFNVSRFSIFSIHFGANFIVQFLILSFLFGIPMLWLQMCLGSKIGDSPVGMWHISPICKGIGIAILLAHGITTLYSAISLGWVLMYFRDTFIGPTDQYEWQKYFELYRGPSHTNQSTKLAETVADYFNGVVLQRLHLGPGRGAGGIGMGNVRFHLAFNLAIVWCLIFLVLCKGIKSYGRFIPLLAVAPMVLLIAVSCKFLSVVQFDSIQDIFPATDWQDFFLNSHSWVSAAQETFLTWGLLGVSVYSIYCNSSRLQNNRTELRREAFAVVFLTLFVLIVAAMFASACVQILHTNGYYYFPGSFENMGSYVFLLPTDRPLPAQLSSTPSKWMTRYSTVLGESFRKFSIQYPKESGYQVWMVLRLVTELLPSTIASSSKDILPPIVSILSYLTLLLFGVAQLATMWKPLASLLGDSPSGVLLSCVTALFLGIPLATESGISIIHFLDTVIGGAWWLLLLWFAHIIGVFLVRGRPYTSDLLVKELQLFEGFSAFVAFSWNVLVPVGLTTLCVIEYRLSNVYDFFHWRGSSYWPLWSRQVAGIIQTLFLLIVPITCIVQIYRYLSKGPPDILERIESLYRPVLQGERDVRHPPLHRLRPPNMQNQPVITIEGQSNQVVQADEPPKYTPPPSYTTATGARIAKMLRQSIRRSMRRILGESSHNRRQQQSIPPVSGPPPDYSVQEERTVSCIEMGPRPLYNSATMERRRSLNIEQPNSQPIAPQDVALLLRPSRLLTFTRTMSLGDNVVDNVLRSSTRRHSRSVENLVLHAEQIGESSVINLSLDNDKEYTNESSVI